MSLREPANRMPPPSGAMRAEGTDYECFCGDHFESREQLIAHNVDKHGWNEGESRRAVMEKYPA